MADLPSSIEAYLEESGFTGTEILVLKRLLEGEAMTLRELAAKTGKSTGALDQIMKKLIIKDIVRKETINGTQKYSLNTLQTVVRWMEEDVRKRQQLLQFKFQNFESFVSTLQNAKRRPEMEHFEGINGMKKAYQMLLERGNDFVQYGPTLWLAEEDPLRDFRVQYFRERHKRGIFSRVITHDTVLGRRFQSRDPFEYRKTVLVDPEMYPFFFEKITAGDTVACFQLQDNLACFIRYPELAQDERAFFDRLWNKKTSPRPPEQTKDVPQLPPGPPRQPVITVVPVHIRALSSLREFFLGRKSLATFAIFGLVAGAITYGLYRHNISLNTKRIQDRVKSIAATAALQFDPVDLNELRTTEDIQKPQYAKVIYQLNLIRNQNEGLKYVYIMRMNKDSGTWEWVADADSLDPYAEIDLNGDGVIDEADHLSPPGEIADVAGQDIDQALHGPTASMQPYTDQWGTWISGWAPVKDTNDQAVAIVGVDIYANEVQNLTQRAFIPLYYFFGFFLIFLFVRLAAFNRSLFQELCEVCKVRRTMLIVGGAFALTLFFTVVIFFFNRREAIESAREISGFQLSVFLPFFVFIAVCILYLLFYTPGYRSSLFYKFWKYIARKKVLIPAAFIVMSTYWLTFALYFYTFHLLKEQTGKRLMAIAATAASQINAEDLEPLRFARDMQRDEYQRVFQQLNDIRRKNPQIQFAYIWRPTESEGFWEFVADADSNYFIPAYYDHTGDFLLDEADENLWPGERQYMIFHSPIIYKEGLLKPSYDTDLVDQWGHFVTGSAPIFDKSGAPIAVLGLDILVKDIHYLIIDQF